MRRVLPRRGCWRFPGVLPPAAPGLGGGGGSFLLRTRFPVVIWRTSCPFDHYMRRRTRNMRKTVAPDERNEKAPSKRMELFCKKIMEELQIQYPQDMQHQNREANRRKM